VAIHVSFATLRLPRIRTKTITLTGWAFAQISDMWDWWTSEVELAAVVAAGVTLTGYSLGAPLANEGTVRWG